MGCPTTGKVRAGVTLIDSDEGKTVKVEVSFTDNGGNAATLTSAATDVVAAAPTHNSSATGAPAISGTARVGETLTADTSDISDPDGVENAVFAYQWIAGGAEIEGATESNYTLTESEQGSTVQQCPDPALKPPTGETHERIRENGPHGRPDPEDVLPTTFGRRGRKECRRYDQ